MKHAFLILAHDDEYLLNKLVQSLDYENSDIYIHLDIDCKLNEEDVDITKIKHSNIYFAKRYKCKWGTIGISYAIRSLILEAQKYKKYDYYHLLSGRDLLIKSFSELDEFLSMNIYNNISTNRKTNYLSFYYQTELYFDRYNLYNFNIEFWRSDNFIRRYGSKVLNVIGLRFQKIFGVDRLKENLKYIKPGSCWWSVSSDFFEKICQEIDWAIKLFDKHSFASDEAIIQAIVIKTGFENSIYKDNDLESNLRLIDFDRGNGASPYEFTMKDRDEIFNSKYYFARKFSSKNDVDIINDIIKNIKE